MICLDVMIFVFWNGIVKVGMFCLIMERWMIDEYLEYLRGISILDNNECVIMFKEYNVCLKVWWIVWKFWWIYDGLILYSVYLRNGG